MDFDNVKENIQPLAIGRDVSLLQASLRTESQQEHLVLRTQLEESINKYEGDDPLDPWFSYISWIEQSYPSGGKESGLHNALYKCLSRFENVEQYKQDRRFIRLFIKFAESQKDQIECYQQMYNSGTGTMVADFYIAWAYCYDLYGNSRKADEIFRLGIACHAEPFEELNEAHVHFGFSVGQRMLYSDGDEASNVNREINERRLALQSLRGHRRKDTIGSIRTGYAVKSSTPGIVNDSSIIVASTSRGHNRKHHLIVNDENQPSNGLPIEPPAATSKEETGEVKTTLRSIIDAARHQENLKEPAPWNKAHDKLPSNKSKCFSKGTSSDLGFTIHVDDSSAISIKTPLDIPITNYEPRFNQPMKYPPGKWFDKSKKREWLTPVTIEMHPEPRTFPAYNKCMLYPRPNIEFQQEELRAYRYYKQNNVFPELTRPKDVYWRNGIDANVRQYPNFAKSSKPQKLDELDTYYCPPKVNGLIFHYSKIYASDQQKEYQFEELAVQKMLERQNTTVYSVADMEETVCYSGNKMQRRKSFFPTTVVSSPTVAVLSDINSETQPTYSNISSSSLSRVICPERDDIENIKTDRTATTTITTPKTDIRANLQFPKPSEPATLTVIPKDNFLFKKPISPIETSSVIGNSPNGEQSATTSTTSTGSTSTASSSPFYDGDESCSTQIFNICIKSQFVSTPIAPQKQAPARQFGTVLKEREPDAESEIVTAVAEVVTSPALRKQLSTILETSETGTTQGTTHSTGSGITTIKSTSTYYEQQQSKSSPSDAVELQQRLRTNFSIFEESFSDGARAKDDDHKQIKQCSSQPLAVELCSRTEWDVENISPASGTNYLQGMCAVRFPDEKTETITKSVMRYQDDKTETLHKLTFARNEQTVEPTPVDTYDNLIKDKVNVEEDLLKSISNLTLPPSPPPPQPPALSDISKMEALDDSFSFFSKSPTKAETKLPKVLTNAKAKAGIIDNNSFAIFEDDYALPSKTKVVPQNDSFFQVQPQRHHLMAPTTTTVENVEEPEKSNILLDSPVPNKPVVAITLNHNDSSKNPKYNIYQDKTFPETDTPIVGIVAKSALKSDIGVRKPELIERESMIMPSNNKSLLPMNDPNMMKNFLQSFESFQQPETSISKTKPNIQLECSNDKILASSSVSMAYEPGKKKSLVYTPKRNENIRQIETNEQFFEANAVTEMFATNNSMIKNSTLLPHSVRETKLTTEYEGMQDSLSKGTAVDSKHTDDDRSKSQTAMKTELLSTKSNVDTSTKVKTNSGSSQSTAEECNMSIYYQKTPPARFNNKWDSYDDSNDECKTPPSKNIDLNQSMHLIKQSHKNPCVNPFNSDLINAFLDSMDFNHYLESLSNCQMVKTIKRLHESMIIDVIAEKFEVLKRIGEGGYGIIFSAKHCKTGKTYALKQERPANYWEYYILLELQARLCSDKLLHAYMQVEYALFSNSSSILISDYSMYGSIISVCNKVKKYTNKNMNEYIVMFLTCQLLDIIDHLHAIHIIHADLKADNILLMKPLNYPSDDFHLQLIDFGCSIDMKQFPEMQTFQYVHGEEDTKCVEMREKRPWTYQLDLFGLAGIIHVMLFGKYMSIEKRASNRIWMPQTHIPRYFKKTLWETIFHTLLNIRDCQTMPNLQELRALLKEEITDNEKNFLEHIAEFNRSLTVLNR